MEEKVIRAFDRLSMPPKCAGRIRQALENGQKTKEKEAYVVMKPVSNPREGWGAIVAACLILVVAVGVFTLHRSGGEVVAAEATAAESTAATERPSHPELEETIDPEVMELVGIWSKILDFPMVDDQTLLSYSDGRLFFSWGGKRVDITDKFSEDKPYVYRLQDAEGTIYWLAVGGQMTGSGSSLKSLGLAMWKLEPGETQIKIVRQVDYTDEETGEERQWHKTVREYLQARLENVHDVQMAEPPLEHKTANGQGPSWLGESEGRLYFVGNGEDIDITEQISLEEPFTYAYLDSSGTVHYLAVGGVYDGALGIGESKMGWAEWTYDLTGGEGMELGWDGKSIGYWDNETDEEYAWHVKAKEVLAIPFG